MSDVAERPIEEILLERYRAFKSTSYAEHRELYADLASAQSPRILFITCSDSRVVPSAILAGDPGDVFVCQIVGNIVTPYGMIGGVSATVEYAVTMLKVQAIVVCGHSDCGAMKALLDGERYAKFPAITSWLSNSETALRIAQLDGESLGEDDLLARTIRENVIAQIEHLRTHPSVAMARRTGLQIFGWVYDIASGGIERYDERSHEFRPLDPAP